MSITYVVLLSASIPTGLIALVGWLFRTYITEHLKRDLEQTKSNLNHELETHKRDLSISRFRFERIHEKRLEVMIEFYEKLALTDMSLETLTAEYKKGSSHEAIKEQEKEDFKKSAESMNDMWLFFYKNKVLFKEDQCDQIDEISRMYGNIFRNFKYRFGAIQQNNISDDLLKVLKSQFDETRELKEKIPKILKSIGESIKNDLGITGHEKNS
jgi:hypothetical protein